MCSARRDLHHETCRAPADHQSRIRVLHPSRILAVLSKVEERAVEFDEYQALALGTDQTPGNDERALVVPLLGLASEVGDIVTQYKKRLRDGEAHDLFGHRILEELGDALWYIANIASKLNVSLDEVAVSNLAKTQDRWPRADQTSKIYRLLDASDPVAEQLPRRFGVEFSHDLTSGEVRLSRAGSSEPYGNVLTDRNVADDGYRFHDVFHLSYCAVLGWSPVARKFLDCRRDSQPEKRSIQDGGRAIVIEEAIAALVFDYARKEHYLENVHALDFTLLTTIKSLTDHLEVRNLTAREWEQAILSGYRVWRLLRQHGGGIAEVDLLARTIAYVPSDRGD